MQKPGTPVTEPNWTLCAVRELALGDIIRAPEDPDTDRMVVRVHEHHGRLTVAALTSDESIACQTPDESYRDPEEVVPVYPVDRNFEILSPKWRWALRLIEEPEQQARH